MKPSQTHSGRSQPSSESAEMIRIIGKLFSMYPLAGNQSPKLTAVAYMQELSDVPTIVLSHALHSLTRKQGSFLPTVAAIRAEAAMVVKRAQWPAQGQNAPGYNPNGDPLALPDPDRWLTRDRILEALPAGVRERVELIGGEGNA